MAKITSKMLKDAGACSGQVVLFRKHFGRSVEVTRERCIKFAGVFTWDWAAENLLLGAAWVTYNAARAEIRATFDAARAGAFFDAWALDHPEETEG